MLATSRVTNPIERGEDREQQRQKRRAEQQLQLRLLRERGKR